MTLDLFDELPESLSPKEQWKKDNKISVYPPGDKGIHNPKRDVSKWVAWKGDDYQGTVCEGLEETQALWELSRKLEINYFERK